MKTPTEYLRLLQSLLPFGRAWNRDDDSNMSKFLLAQADEFSRVDSRSDDLLQERDTRYSSELLIDHEIDLGLPDECSRNGQTISERRLAAHSKLIALGQQNPAYFIELAAAYGWTITITEYTPFWCGLGAMGDMCGRQEVIFYWKVSIAFSGEVVYFTSGSSEAGDPLTFVPGTSSLICMLKKYKPAHTTLIFDYTGPGFDRGFSSGFDSLPSEEDDYLEGGFDKGFSIGFDVHYGGGFDKNGFGDGFERPR